MECDINDMYQIRNNYTYNVDNLRTNFMTMILDSYNDYLYKDQLSNISNNNKFYDTIEEYFKGFRYDEWHNYVDKLVNNLDDNNESRQKNIIDLKNYDFMSNDKIPKKPNESRLINPKFRRNTKFISFSKNSNIQENQIKDSILEIYSNSTDRDIIKLQDMNSNVVFIDKIFVNYNNEDRELNGNISHLSLEKRADLLIPSRLNMVMKLQLIIVKFLTSLKKFAKKKKEKECLNNNSIKKIETEKFKNFKIIVSSIPFISKKEKELKTELDTKRLKKILDRTKKEKEKKKIEIKKENLKAKIKIFFSNLDEEKEWEEYAQYYDLYEESLNDSAENSNNNRNNRKPLSIGEIKATQELIEEKIIEPKKKVDYVGLKNFIIDKLNQIKNK